MNDKVEVDVAELEEIINQLDEVNSESPSDLLDAVVQQLADMTLGPVVIEQDSEVQETEEA